MCLKHPRSIARPMMASSPIHTPRMLALKVKLSLRNRKLYLLLLLRIILHTGLDPLAALSSMLLRFGLVLEELLDGMSVRDVTAFLNSFTCFHSVHPGLERGELVNVDACPTSCRYPAIMSNVCNSTLCAAQILPVLRSEVLVKHRVETACLGLVPVHTILNVLGGVSREVICLRFFVSIVVLLLFGASSLA
jgi:hypothetical protein